MATTRRVALVAPAAIVLASAAPAPQQNGIAGTPDIEPAVPPLAAEAAPSRIAVLAGNVVLAWSAENAACAWWSDVEGTPEEAAAESERDRTYRRTELATLRLARAKAEDLHDLLLKAAVALRGYDGPSDSESYLAYRLKQDVDRLAPELSALMGRRRKRFVLRSGAILP